MSIIEPEEASTHKNAKTHAFTQSNTIVFALVSHGMYADGTDGRTPDRYINAFANIVGWRYHETSSSRSIRTGKRKNHTTT